MNKNTNILEIQLKGNFSTTKPTTFELLYILGGLILLGPLYFLYFRDWNFYFSPIPSFIFAFIYFLFIGITSAFISQKIHLRFPVTIQVTDEEILIFKNKILHYTFSIKNLESFSWYEMEEGYKSIEIKTNEGKILYIYIESIIIDKEKEDLTEWTKNTSIELKTRLETKAKSIPFSKIKSNIQQDRPQFKGDITKILIFVTIIIIAAFVGSFITIVYIFGDDDPLNKVSSSGISFNSSNYYSYDNQVYFLSRNGNGYFKVKDADCHTFRPLTKDFQYSTDMAADTFNVFFETKKVNGINRQQMRYVGAYYTADNNNVYYKDTIVSGADVNSFETLSQKKMQSYKLLYGKDREHVFYKSYLLPNLNPINARVFDGVDDYVSDGDHVYYKTQEIEQVQASTFEAEKVTNKLIYAHDNASFWINGIPFPNEVRNRFIGTTAVDKSKLKLMAKIGEGSYHMIFYDTENVYYFDEYERAYYFIKKIENIDRLQKITSGVFSIDEDIYFLCSRIYRTKGRSGTTTHSFESELVKLEKTKKSDLQFIKTIRDGIIWYNGTDYLFSYNENEESRSGMYKIDLKKSTKDIDNISYMNERILMKMSGGKRLFKIKTRPEWNRF